MEENNLKISLALYTRLQFNIHLIDCSQKTMLKVLLFSKIYPACQLDANGIKRESTSKMSDKHAADQ